MKTAKKNWFDTLNASLESEGLINEWPIGRNINYGETATLVSDMGMFISVYRETDGRYERPIFYKTRINK